MAGRRDSTLRVLRRGDRSQCRRQGEDTGIAECSKSKAFERKKVKKVGEGGISVDLQHGSNEGLWWKDTTVLSSRERAGGSSVAPSCDRRGSTRL